MKFFESILDKDLSATTKEGYRQRMSLRMQNQSITNTEETKEIKEHHLGRTTEEQVL